MQLCKHNELFAVTDSWLDLPIDKRTPTQQMVIDVLYSIGLIEGDGLHNFWRQMSTEVPRIIRSFRMARFGKLADALTESSFCAEVIAKGMDADGHWPFTDSQDKTLSRIERTLYREVENVHEEISRLFATMSA
jgi:hypothetical protein